MSLTGPDNPLLCHYFCYYLKWVYDSDQAHLWVRTQAQRGQVLYPRWHVSRKGSLATSRAVLKPEGGSRSPPASASHGHWSPALWAPWAGVGVSTMGEQASWRPRARRHCQGGFLGDSRAPGWRDQRLKGPGCGVQFRNTHLSQ